MEVIDGEPLGGPVTADAGALRESPHWRRLAAMMNLPGGS